MKQGLIYINYDPYEYVNYFYLAVDDEFVLRSVPNEEIDRIFCKLDQMGIEDSDIIWCVIADQDATDWQYDSAFSERGRKMNSANTIDYTRMAALLKNEFRVDFAFDNNEYADKYLHMIFPVQGKNNSLSVNKEDSIDKTKEIFQDADNNDEITEFAKIILEKYERVCHRE